MSQLNRIFFYALILIIILMMIAAIFSAVILKKKIKYRWFYFLTAVFLLCLAEQYVVYAPFRNLNKEVCMAHPEIETLQFHMINKEQICKIRVYLKNYEDNETIERLVYDLMKRMDQDPLLADYLNKRDYDCLEVNMQIFSRGRRGPEIQFIAVPTQ